MKPFLSNIFKYETVLNMHIYTLFIQEKFITSLYPINIFHYPDPTEIVLVTGEPMKLNILITVKTVLCYHIKQDIFLAFQKGG